MSSIFGTGFGQQQQQQQQPQQPQQNAFGSFGGSGFGTFGQNPQQPQQQQPQTNPMFGNLASSSNPSGGFGAFASNTTSAFGQPKSAFGQPATGTGAFGQPSAFGSTAGGAFGNAGGGAFGSSTSGGGAFGQPVQQQSTAFGSSGALFGKPAGGAFGNNALAPALPTAGSSNPPFQEFQERDGSPGNLNTMLHYQSISCMPAYRNVSFEELRVQDYHQGRRTANAFGAAPSAFGQPSQQQSNLFGQPSTATTNTGAFGQPTGAFGAFGQQQQQPNAFGAFGQPQQQPATGAFGAFGQQNQQQQPAGGAFGAFGQQNQPPAFGAFGQQNQQNKPFGAFGQAQPSTSGFGAFGSNTGGTSTFGQPQQQQQNPSPFGAFGQQQQNNQSSLLKPSVFGQPSGGGGGGLFGNTNAGSQQGGSGLFGQPAGGQQQSGAGAFGQPSGGTGAFGQPTQPIQQPSIFGQSSSAPTTGGGIFGTATQPQNQQQPQQQQPGSGFSSLFSKPPGGGLFGSTHTAQNQTQTNQQQQQNPNPANPLFGGGGGLFGNTTQHQQQQSQGGTTNPLFGGGGGLFGGKPAPAGGGLFGGTNTQQQQPVGGGLFGSTTTSQQPQQSSIFGTSTQTQPSLTASIDQPLPSTLPPLPPLAASLSPPKRKSNVFAYVAAPRLGLNGNGLHYTPPRPGSKLRGFGTGSATTTHSPIMQNPFAASASASVSPSKHNGKLLSEDAFLGRQSVKKLVLDKRVEEGELHRLRTSANAEVRFNPALGVAAREREQESSTRRPASRLADVSNVSTPPPAAAKDNSKGSPAPLGPQEGEYWCLPPVAELQRLSFGELRAVEGFTAGRVGFGTIQFLAPVDLTAVPAIVDVPGKIVVFEHAECVLYPDERLRPPKGEGLNVPARIKLDRCWAVDKATREPIKDVNDPKHLLRLRKMKAHEGAEFVSFDMETGVWEFTVQEF